MHLRPEYPGSLQPDHHRYGGHLPGVRRVLYFLLLAGPADIRAASAGGTHAGTGLGGQVIGADPAACPGAGALVACVAEEGESVEPADRVRGNLERKSPGAVGSLPLRVRRVVTGWHVDADADSLGQPAAFVAASGFWSARLPHRSDLRRGLVVLLPGSVCDQDAASSVDITGRGRCDSLAQETVFFG